MTSAHADTTGADHGSTSILPFRGARFTMTGPALQQLTFVPPSSWAMADRPDGDEGLLGLLAPAFAVIDGSTESAETLRAWYSAGQLSHDPVPAMYVYRRVGADVLTGLVVAASLRTGALVAHEEVIDSAVARQARLERAGTAQLEPIVAIVTGAARRDVVRSVAAGITGPPDMRLDDDGVTHELWVVTDPAVHAQVTQDLDAAVLLVADGHHRLAAWSQVCADPPEVPVRPWEYALTMLVDDRDDALALGPVHRVVAGLQPSDLHRVVDLRLFDAPHDADGRRGTVEHLLPDATPPDGCLVFGDGRWYVLISRADAGPSYAVSALHEDWLPRLGVSEGRISYVHSVADAVAEATATGGTAFLLRAPDLLTVLDASRRGTPLPHKATSFGPKPLVGLVMRHWAPVADDLTGTTT